MDVLDPGNWTSEASTELRKFEKFLIIALKVDCCLKLEDGLFLLVVKYFSFC